MEKEISTFALKVVTLEKIEFFDENTTFLKIRTSIGDTGILPNHTNYMTSLGEGMMEIKTKEKEIKYFVSGGFLEVSNNFVTVLAEEAINAENEQEVRKIKAEILEKAIEQKRKEDRDIMGTKKRIQDSLVK